mmetsp:Transcript_39426/g.92662  ORF Transcript_39426/g.92662 Transcript_39426/m.92662 type:complete len:107 (-) Transcript_39426:1054-1374(-)
MARLNSTRQSNEFVVQDHGVVSALCFCLPCLLVFVRCVRLDACNNATYGVGALEPARSLVSHNGPEQPADAGGQAEEDEGKVVQRVEGGERSPSEFGLIVREQAVG